MGKHELKGVGVGARAGRCDAGGWGREGREAAFDVGSVLWEERACSSSFARCWRSEVAVACITFSSFCSASALSSSSAADVRAKSSWKSSSCGSGRASSVACQDECQLGGRSGRWELDVCVTERRGFLRRRWVRGSRRWRCGSARLVLVLHLIRAGHVADAELEKREYHLRREQDVKGLSSCLQRTGELLRGHANKVTRCKYSGLVHATKSVAEATTPSSRATLSAVTAQVMQLLSPSPGLSKPAASSRHKMI